MPPRRQGSNYPPQGLSPYDNPAGSTSSTAFPRSTSPSGLTSLLSKPAKWFSRTPSGSRTPSSGGPSEPRSSTSSSINLGLGRKPKISHPTDPRPILSTLQSEPYVAKHGVGSQSVYDLSLTRTKTAAELPSLPHTSSSSPSRGNKHTPGLGDLRAMSRKPWSKSAEELGKLSISAPSSPATPNFNDKIEAYRGGSPSGSPVSSHRQPFPTVVTTSAPSTSPLSSSPPQSGGSLSPLASARTGTPPASPASPGTSGPLLHARSHSFTPKLPSKLSASKLGPPSPQRKGSSASETEVDSRDKPRGSAFPFTFGGKASTATVYGQLPAAGGESPLLPPPTIIEPDDGAGRSDKRTSQITFHAGFVNRLAGFQPSPHAAASASLNKGWKPFKLVLRGTKLQFYKPPGDRAAEVKELFPTEIVPPDQQDKELAADVLSLGIEVLGEAGEKEEPRSPTGPRRKRAFWGRRTHPDLGVDAAGNIEKGTTEALVHEAVFATRFREEGEEGQTDVAEEKTADWQAFASAVLFALPMLVGKSKFEGEFVRFCTYLVSGAEEALKEKERSRVSWLANEYLLYHTAAADGEAWEEFRAETIPTFVCSMDTAPLPPSASVQAIFSRTPNSSMLGSPGQGSNAFSPNVNTFSPRPPNTEKVLSLAEVLKTDNTPRAKASMDVRHRPSGSRDLLWGILDREGFTKDILIRLSPRLIARSLLRYNRRALEAAPDNLTPDMCISWEGGDAGAGTAADAPPFFGSDERPHWLTKLILLHVLGPDVGPAPAFPVHARRSEDQRGAQQQTSRTHTRSEVLGAWARIGELCRAAGDECAWRAIVAGLCARPVARLEKAWKRVDPSALELVEAWAGHGGAKAKAGVEKRVTPWGGDMRDKVRAALDRAKVGEGEEWAVKMLREAREGFEGFRTAFSLCPRKEEGGEDAADEDAEKLAGVWRDLCASGGGTGNVASQFQRVDQFMSLSLAAESRRKGLYEPYFWTKASSAAPTTHTLVPLLFTEPLPVAALVNRAEVWRGRLESGANRLDLQDVQALRRQAAGLRPSDPNRRHSLSGAANLNPIDMGGTVLPLWDGELLLLIQPPSDASPSRPSSRAPSRPTSTIMDTAPGERPVSRAPSIRVKPGSSQGLERKASLARRNSLPSISARASLVIPEHPSERPVRVVVKAGTLDRLVEVLAHGLPGVSVSIADDNGEMPLREGKTRDVKLDRSDFASIWWNVFRSFVSPLVFFELLRKRYVSALLSGLNTANELRDIARVRSDIFETITEWLQNGNGSQDILDDAALFQAVQAFLTSTTDHEVPDSPAKDDHGVIKAWSNLAQSREAVLVLFTAHTMRPPIQSLSVSEPLPSVSETPSFTGEPPDLDKISPEDLVDNFDAMACAAFRNVTEEDLFVTSDLLEVQSADRMGWFLPRDASATSDDVEIQTIYTHITEVQPSPMISELTQDELFRLLPPGLRSCIRAHLVLRKWLVSRIVAPRLGLQVRQARMDLLLRAIEVCRRRSEGNADDSGFSIERPAVPSFVEVVLTSAILSVESRLHQRAWTTVANSRKVPCDSLAGFLARPQCRPSSAKWPLTTDMGWTLERMLEIISLTDVLDPSTAEGRTLVNFDKRRHLCSLIDGTPAASSIHRSRRRRAIDRRDFERLNNIEREVSAIHFDLRSIRDDAYKEGASSGGPMTPKRNQRPFQKLISAQQEKNKRDRWLRDRLGKERKQEQQKHDRRDEYLTKAMHTRRPYSAAQRQHRMKKSGSSSFFQNLMRPISSAFALDVDANTVKRTAAELDFTPSGKPTLVLSVVDARVSTFVNHYRSYTFQLDTEDGGHYLLQAVSRREMMKWIQTIDRVSKTAAKRRLTYLGNSPKPQLADHIHDRPTTASRDPTAVFGVDLEFLLKRESGGNEIPHGAVPQFIERSLSEVESRGLSEVGIYRIAGASSEVNGLKEALNRGEWPITENSDIYAVCDLIKAWFRVLPEPVFPSFSYHDMIDAMKIDDFNPRLERIRTVVQALPRHNFDLLKRVVEHLDKVTDYEEHNQMGSDALAIVFSPNLLRAPHNDFVMIMANMSYTNKLVKALITHFHTIFDDEDIDAEADQEDDFDEPIPEEDEEPETEFAGPSPIGYPASENDSDPRIASANS